jgi:glycosyltransferase involved in cell wall biosynthesis
VTLSCVRLDGPNPLPSSVSLEPLPDAEASQAEWLVSLLKAIRADVVLERYSLSSGPALHAARQCGVPFILEVNAPLVDEAARYRGLQRVDTAQARERRILREAGWIIAVSRAIRDHVVAAGAAAERVTVVPNGVDLELFSSGNGRRVRQEHGLTGRLVIGFAGSLKPWHGMLELAEAFASLPGEPCLLIVGDGPARGAIESYLRHRGLEARSVVTGAVPHAEMPSHLAAMDIAVAPYLSQRDFYFSPLKLVEYLAAGIPLVTTAQGDIPDLVGAAGLLVQPGSVAELSAALTRLIEDPKLRVRLSHAGRLRATDFTWDGAAARVEGALEGSLAKAVVVR